MKDQRKRAKGVLGVLGSLNGSNKAAGPMGERES